MLLAGTALALIFIGIVSVNIPLIILGSFIPILLVIGDEG